MGDVVYEAGEPTTTVARPSRPARGVGHSTFVSVSPGQRHRLRRYIGGVILADGVVIALSTWAAAMARATWDVWGEHETVRPAEFILAGFLIGCLWLCWLGASGSYFRRTYGTGSAEFKALWRASLMTAGMVGLACYLLKVDLSRGFLAITFLVGTSALLVERYVARKLLHGQRVRGRLLRRVVAVGGPAAIEEVTEVLNRERYAGYEVVAACVPTAHRGRSWAIDIPVFELPDDVSALCAEIAADTVLVAGGSFLSARGVRQIGWQLEGSDVDLVVVPSLTDVAGPRLAVSPVAGLPLLHVDPPQAGAAVRWAKRCFDLVVGGAFLALAAPLMLAVAVAVKLGDGGPVLFRQERVGLRGQEFRVFKFRSMGLTADDELDGLLEDNEADGALFKLRNDPRVTTTGRVIRRYSLDELPQLFNVLCGQMSLVGPRPPLPREASSYDVDVFRRLHVLPGMTGLWQVSGRSTLTWRESIRLDLYYVDNWSMWQDLMILFKTARAVIAGRGAY